MPGKLKVRIVAGRHLPVMDRASDLTDAFVEVKFGNTTFKTDVFPKSLNPQWNSEWFKFEVDDEDLQDEPLQITVLDHDTYSANDAIGKVYIDIDPLLSNEAAAILSGWFPIYDTIHGIRGEINVMVKVDLFNDLNRFRQSSCGVKFFCTTSIPKCYKAVTIHGFVEELVVNEDPEYQWIDRIRTPRASNEARQRLISLMSGELQRKIGLKVLEMGGNAVVGYLQCFDLEGESGLVVRAIGTACTLDKLSNTVTSLLPPCSSPSKDLKEVPFSEDPNPVTHSSGPSTPLKNQTYSFSPSKSYSRQSSSSDTDLSLTPKTAAPSPEGPRIFLFPSSPPLFSGSPLHKSAHLLRSEALHSLTPPHSGYVSPVCLRKTVSFNEELLLTASGMGSGSGGKDGVPLKTLYRQQTQSAFEHREFPFFTLTTFPPGFLVHVGGVVSARSVKLLDRIHNPAFVGIMGNTRSYKLLDWNSFNADEPETRDAWWAEIRQEIKSHGKALGCHAVVGYSESTSICEEVCILSASGTAAVLNPKMLQDCSVEGCSEHRLSRQPSFFSTGSEKGEFDFFLQCQDSASILGLDDTSSQGCSFCHIPYDELNMPFPAHLTYCYVCRKQKVPDVLFTTIEPPLEAAVTGRGCLIQARLCRQKKKTQGEANATAISNLLPFMEYELHTQLMNKLKLRGMNALFGLRIQIAVGENMLMGLASATGVYLTALPSPGGIQIAGKTPSDSSYEQHISNMQKKINDMIIKNREIYEINPPIDDADAVEDIHSLLTDAPTPAGFYSCNTEIMPGINNWTSDLQMFTSVRVFRLNNVTSLTSHGLNKAFSDLCENLLKTLYFKLRSMVPCCLCHVNFNVALPEDELIQVAVTAVAITYDKDQAQCVTKAYTDRTLLKASVENEDQLQFTLELCMESQSSQSAIHFSPSKVTGITESGNLQQVTPAAQRATSVDYSSFADRCSSWIEFIKQKAQTIRRGSIKTIASLDKASPLAEAHTRHRSPISCTTSTVTVVEMTPLSFIPGAKITKYLGIINMFFIRETTSLREEGGVSGFLHAFIAEVFAMVRAHVAALGGNAVVSYIMKQCVFMENPNKNQAQCLINVSGDAVNFFRDADVELTSTQPQTSGLQTGNGSGDIVT
ncbi:C2 domain-containing protein 5 isoform X9 [Chiloscyllium plagiosum]|uniref:C2 domain-containing protein 5 isoform X9 n=1 Tax=Chiloscyllium plagiosum TaxID=36176 RepID=UPI001CB7F15E|nr:C2 domain-containing protein 5 isoform X9 [Chiloscyllium plagiosum]